MNLKTIGLSATLATALATGAVLSSTQAQAATLGAGGFLIEGKSNLSNLNLTTNPTSFKLNLTGFNLVGTDGALSGLTGTPTLASLDVTKTGNGQFQSAAKNSFITGLKLGLLDIVFDLNPVTYFGSVKSATSYGLTSDDFTGTLKSSDGSSILADGVALNAYRFNVGNSVTNFASVGVTTVPTPALLPGLIAMGIGMMRKRKSEAVES